jgi:hypothetical protein
VFVHASERVCVRAPECQRVCVLVRMFMSVCVRICVLVHVYLCVSVSVCI